MDLCNATFTPDPSPDLAAAVLRARVMAAMAREIALRRPYWIGGIPDALDLAAAHKAVARLLKTTPETVAVILAQPIQPIQE